MKESVTLYSFLKCFLTVPTSGWSLLSSKSVLATERLSDVVGDLSSATSGEVSSTLTEIRFTIFSKIVELRYSNENCLETVFLKLRIH